MVKVYANLIIHDRMTFEQVPAALKPAVRQDVIDAGYPDKVPDEG